MYIQIKTADCSQNKRVEVSKLTSVKELKSLVEEELNVKPDRQRLFFRGKQLEDDYKVFDYSINLNDVVMLMVKPDLSAFKFCSSEQKEGGSSNKEQGGESSGHEQENKNSDKKQDNENFVLKVPVNNSNDGSPEKVANAPCPKVSISKNSTMAKSNFFMVGDKVDAIYDLYGAWFEGKIVEIVPMLKVSCTSSFSQEEAGEAESKNNETKDISSLQDTFMYMVSFDCCVNDPPSGIPLAHVRPRMCTTLKLTDVKEGDLVLSNYNIVSPEERGFWYDMTVTKVSQDLTRPELVGTIYVGRERTKLKNCKVLCTDEVYKIVEPQLITEGKVSTAENTSEQVQDKKSPSCSFCLDNPKKKCKNCACHICGGKDEPNRQIICDECEMAYHLRCLNPPLDALPDVDEWYCPLCKTDENEIVRAGGKLKESKKKKNLPSAKNEKSKRDWGKGMACAGRTKECTIVPPNHFGPIPGVDVGTCWKFRLTASEAGVHRPPVAGIHGRDNEGAYSIVLSGGYEDDVDNGDEFYYTGSGGRDLSGNKRTSEQSSDQTLTRMNLALALNCNAPINKEKGAEASDWKGGKPVRVLRNYKLAKHSEYAPEEGNRYDGIYKVVKYYPEKGESGFVVWRYLLRRDDPAAAPWSEAGKKHIESLGLTMIYPDGYEEMIASKEAKAGNTADDNSKSKKRPRKNVLEELPLDNPNKKLKVAAFVLDEEITLKISKDVANVKNWDSCKIALQEGKKKFLCEVQQQFTCICCQELVCDPVTTVCCHNICKACLKRAFAAKVYSCPNCRQNLGQDFDLTTNQNLSASLLYLFPGYTVGR